MMNEEYELLFLLVESEKWKVKSEKWKIALMQLGNRKPKNVYSLPLQGDKRGSILSPLSISPQEEEQPCAAPYH